MQINDHIANIIARKLQEQASAEELQQLQDWMNDDASNPATLAEMEQIWRGSEQVLSQPVFDTPAAWSKLEAKINMPGKNTVRSGNKIVSLFYGRWAAAAAAALIIAIAGGWWLWSQHQWQTISATDGNRSVTLADGSVVALRKGSSIKYPVVFNKEERLVQLSGEAFFQVQHNEKLSFHIVASHSDVLVLGTSFLVRSKEDADEIVVASGKVSVTDKNKKSEQVILAAGQKAVLQNDQFMQSPVASSNYLAWNTGLLDFKHTPLATVLEDMEHYYGTPIGMTSEVQANSQDIYVTARFENQSLEQALDELKLTTGLQVKKEGDKTVFSRK